MVEKPPETVCSICFSSPPKYRCPRCPAVRTCSLPCYKRHQQRATCTGLRDNGAFVKKSQLTTAAAIDYDYNFLVKVERALRTAEDQSDDATRPSKRRKLASNPTFNDYLKDNGITVYNAPPGLQRAKSNQSRFLPRSKKIVWTTEWIGEEGQQHMTEVHGDDLVWSAYATMAARFFNGDKKAKLHIPGISEDTNKLSSQSCEKRDTNETMASETNESHDITKSESSTRPRNLASLPGQKVHLYLLRPRCLSDRRILQPLVPSSTLTESLSRRHLDEFPTVYHLPFPPEQLPESKYWLSCRYDEHMKQEMAGLDKDDIVRRVRASLGTALGTVEAEKDNSWDSKRVLEMLRRDMEGRAA